MVSNAPNQFCEEAEQEHKHYQNAHSEEKVDCDSDNTLPDRCGLVEENGKAIKHYEN